MRPFLRPFTPDDYPAIVAVENAIYPDYPGTVDEWRFGDENRDPKCQWQRWVAEADGAIVAFGGYSQSSHLYHRRKFFVGFSVHPDCQGQGIGRLLYDGVMDALAPFDPLLVRTDAREDRQRSIRFLAERGFIEEMREWESRLDVGTFNFAPFAGAEERVRESGIAIKTLRELEADPDRDRKLYDLDWELSQDVPHPDTLTRPDFAHFLRAHLGSPNLVPDAYFVAVNEAGDYVGMSNLWASKASDNLDTGLTGVKRDYRRRGIALALKLRAVAYARERGCPMIKTWNEQNNRGMLGINARLGFARQPAWISFAKVLKEGE